MPKCSDGKAVSRGDRDSVLGATCNVTQEPRKKYRTPLLAYTEYMKFVLNYWGKGLHC